MGYQLVDLFYFKGVGQQKDWWVSFFRTSVTQTDTAQPLTCSLTSPQQEEAEAYANNSLGQVEQEFKELSQQLENRWEKPSTAISAG